MMHVTYTCMSTTCNMHVICLLGLSPCAQSPGGQGGELLPDDLQNTAIILYNMHFNSQLTIKGSQPTKPGSVISYGQAGKVSHTQRNPRDVTLNNTVYIIMYNMILIFFKANSYHMFNPGSTAQAAFPPVLTRIQPLECEPVF